MSSHNFDFIELRKTGDDLPLADYKITYYNSSDNPSGEISFGENAMLVADSLVLGFHNSPQFSELPEEYLYKFGSSGLASTGGRLQLLYDGEVVDELCWGKTVCENSINKFATKQEENSTAVRCYGECEEVFGYEKYYPEPNFEAIQVLEPVIEPQEPEPIVSCEGLAFTEIYSYYIDDVSEQFVELYNTTDRSISLDGCYLRYKSKLYPLSGEVASASFYVSQDLVLTKNPNSPLTIELIDDNGVVASADYPHGQKKGVSYALFDGAWLFTYQPTPGEDNQAQEYRNCPEGKVINPDTGNCINESSANASEPKTCPEGQYLNPETNRCKKAETTKQKECAEGYERNPETGRCKKVITATKQEYPVEPIPDEATYDSPKIFIATAGLIAVALITLSVIVWQFRAEIGKLIKRIFPRGFPHLSRVKLLVCRLRKS